MDEPVGVSPALDQFLTERIPESHVNLVLRDPQRDRQRGCVGDGAETGELLQSLPRTFRTANQLLNHEVNHIVGVPLRMKALEVPGPSPPPVIKGQEPLVGKRVKKLDNEERIPLGFRLHQACKRIGLFRVAPERVRDKVSEVRGRQGRQLDVLHSSGCADRLQLAHERMRCGDLIIAECADEEEIAEIGPAQQMFQKVERRRIEPLQVVEEQREGMFRPSEHTDELSKHHLKAPLCVPWWKLNDRRWLSDEGLQLRNETYHQCCVRSQRLLQGVAPWCEIGIALAEQRPDQGLKRLCQRRVGNIAFELIEFAGSEQATRRHQHRLENR